MHTHACVCMQNVVLYCLCTRASPLAFEIKLLTGLHDARRAFLEEVAGGGADTAWLVQRSSGQHAQMPAR